jgi:hypothetical protein
MAKTFWYNQQVLMETYLFGKSYYWMQDTEGTIYLAKNDANGNPDLS